MCGRATLSRQVTVMVSRRQQQAARQRQVRVRAIALAGLTPSHASLYSKSVDVRSGPSHAGRVEEKGGRPPLQFEVITGVSEAPLGHQVTESAGSSQQAVDEPIPAGPLLRDTLAQYFVNEGAVEWQDSKV